MNNNDIGFFRTRNLTRTAILLALTIIFQMLRPYLLFMGPNNIFIIGTLVNASLLVAAGTVGIQGGILISIIAPIIAFYQGHLTLWFMIPVVALGNSSIVTVFYLIKNRSKYAALGLAAVTKFLVQFGGIQVLMMIFAGNKTAVTPLTKMLAFAFSWPQLVTATLGGIIAIPVLKILDKSIQNGQFKDN